MLIKAEFVTPEFLAKLKEIHFNRDRSMPKESEMDPAQLLKKVLAEAQFQNTDIGGTVFSLLDSMSYDITSNGWDDWSDTTDDLMQEVVNLLAQSYDDIRTDDLEDEEEEEVIPDVEVDEDEVEEDEPDITMVPVAEEEIEEDDIDVIDLDGLETEETPNGEGNKESALSG